MSVVRVALCRRRRRRLSTRGRLMRVRMCAGRKHGWPGHCMPMKIMHANARSFKQTESHRMQEDGSIKVRAIDPSHR